MSKAAPFLLDSDVFIAAKNAYYAFDICPGFWSGVLNAYERGNIRSLDRIRNELLLDRKEEDLVQWVTSEVPAAFFPDSNADDVSAAFAEVRLWVQRNTRYFDRAKAKFATEADGWLVANSMVRGTVPRGGGGVVAAMEHGLSLRRVAELNRHLGIGLRTLRRWRQWWRTAFVHTTLWRGSCGRFVPPVAASALPYALLERFGGAGAARGLAMLRFLSPLTTTAQRGRVLVAR